MKTLTLVLVAAGSFVMGALAWAFRKPAKEAVLKGYNKVFPKKAVVESTK